MAAEDTWGLDVSHNLLCASNGHTSLLSAQNNSVQIGAAGNLDFCSLLGCCSIFILRIKIENQTIVMKKKNKIKLPHKQSSNQKLMGSFKAES